MSTPHLKTYYRRGATILTPEQIEEIRKSKNKVPKYVLVRNFHINENRVEDIWKNSERSQQNGDHSLSNTVDRFPDSSHLLNIGMDENVMQSTSSVPENEVQARMSHLRKYAKELQAES
ncbi:7392_t:CDS:2 [Entrophospora sp. SA101]|nr:7392_t:CDS:2 [Entrophospora sp. SA101]